MEHRDDPRHGGIAVRGGRRRRWWIVLALPAAQAACACHPARPSTAPPHEGTASWHVVEQPDTVHYRLALGEVSSGATTLQRVTPVYPAAQLAACPPAVDITARLIVDRAGKVAEVRPDNAASAAPALAPFLDATRAAALRWQFNPLQINRWAADANGESHVVDSRTEPFSLDYLFRFTCRAGQAQVTTDEAPAPR